MAHKHAARLQPSTKSLVCKTDMLWVPWHTAKTLVGVIDTSNRAVQDPQRMIHSRCPAPLGQRYIYVSTRCERQPSLVREPNRDLLSQKRVERERTPTLQIDRIPPMLYGEAKTSSLNRVRNDQSSKTIHSNHSILSLKNIFMNINTASMIISVSSVGAALDRMA